MDLIHIKICTIFPSRFQKAGLLYKWPVIIDRLDNRHAESCKSETYIHGDAANPEHVRLIPTSGNRDYGLGFPQFGQNFPVLTDPQLQVQEPSGFLLPQFEQKFPEFTVPQLHVQAGVLTGGVCACAPAA